MTEPISRYAPDLTKAQAGIPQLIGDFEFKITDAKTFNRTTKDQKTQEDKDVYGVQYTLIIDKIEDAENEKLRGKTIPLQLYMHVEATEGLNKRFVMAALGFPANEEDDFNAKYADAKWNYDTDGEVIQGGPIPKDSIWAQIVGGRVSATCTVKPDRNDPTRKNQQFDWRPFS